MSKLTSTLTEMEEAIWYQFYGGEKLETVTNMMVLGHPEFSEDVIERLVRTIYLKDFKTD